MVFHVLDHSAAVFASKLNFNMFRAVLLCCFYMLSVTYAMTAEQKAQVHQHFEEIGKGCLKDNPITAEDITSLRSREMPAGDNAPCFMACVFKGTGLFDAQGMLSPTSSLEMAKNVFKDDDEVKLIADYINSCSGVNTEAVSDGEKGCERAIKAFKCMSENAGQFGFDV